MATTSIDTSELEYLKFCRDKLRRIVEVIENKSEDEKKNQLSDDEKLISIRKIIKN